MSEEFERTRVLITVMTYPHPSKSYQEVVCTAGITEEREWVRLYPIDYRYRPAHQQFRKYQWISLELSPRGSGGDKRRESRKPSLDSIQIEGAPLGTENGWLERRRIIDEMPHHTLDELKTLYDTERTSLGIVRPANVLDLEIRESSEEWKPDWEVLFKQGTLFGPEQKPLMKIPFTFHYRFVCEDSKTPHTAMIGDWELGNLYRHALESSESKEQAAEKVKEKFLNELCRDD